jgi:hypothetical protein
MRSKREAMPRADPRFLPLTNPVIRSVKFAGDGILFGLISPPAFNIYLQPERHQLKRAAVIKEEIERLNKELSAILGAPQNRAVHKKNRTTKSNCIEALRQLSISKSDGAIGASRAVCKHDRMNPYGLSLIINSESRNSGLDTEAGDCPAQDHGEDGRKNKKDVCFRARAYAPTCPKGDA